MKKPIVRFVKLRADAVLPRYATAEAAGADLTTPEEVRIMPGGIAKVATGLGCDIPSGWEIQIRPRSGLAAKHGVTVLNAPGTIDSDYQGELCVLLVNHGPEEVVLEAGTRIAQAVMAPVHQADFEWADAVSRATQRGEGGFGSTGA